MKSLTAIVSLLAASTLNCSTPATPASDAGSDARGSSDGEVHDAPNGPVITFPTCPTDIWAGIEDYEGVGTLTDCPRTNRVAASLFQLGGVTIDNNGTEMTPCIAARCDEEWVYVATNDLPHYDFVQTTPNALTENVVVYRLPLVAAELGTQTGATDASSLRSCVAGYEQYLANSGAATPNEPSGLCSNGADLYYYDTLSTGRRDYKAIPCLGSFGFLLSGTAANGPNEAGFPDPWGNPVASFPENAADDLRALDLCGGHTGGNMHYHSVTEACFERDASGAPANSYVDAAEAWDLADTLTGDCSEPSGIVGWSLDGYPIQGPCVCMARGADGSCTDVRRAYSSWVYEGLGAWATESAVAPGSTFAMEGAACTADADCGRDDLYCAWALSDASGSVVASRQCVLVDYAWCTHRYVDRTGVNDTTRVYLDRCNGIEGADGYAYHATMSFPYIQACFRGVAAEQAGRGGMMMMMGGMVRNCGPGVTTMCCGDGVCGGPETAANCAADC